MSEPESPTVISNGTLAPGSGATVAPRAASGAAQPLPASIGRYRIIRLLGEGGMGAVYEAEQDQPRRSVALKVIKAAWASPELRRRFEQESEALGRLHHPGIAQIYEAGSADAGFGVQPFFAMELVHGKPLVEYADGHKLNTRQRLELMIQVCDAVHHAHQRGIIHRDLKPGNILVDETGQPKILDFGLARATDSDAQATRQTDIGQLLGTLAYMSPEQVLADPLALDTRSDVYALGVILYELLAGKMPYTLSRQLHEAVRTIQETDPAPLSSVSKIYRGDIETIAAKALEKDKNRRYGSAAGLAGDIRRHLDDQPITAKPASTSYQLQKFARRHKALVAGVAAVFVVLVAGIVASTWEAVLARRAEKKAQQESAIAQAVNDFLQNDLLGQASAYNQVGSGSGSDPNIKVRTVLDRAAQNIQGKFDKQPEVEAAIRQTIGYTYMDLGLLSQARMQLEPALEASRRLLGPEDPKTLELMAELGEIAGREGHYGEAEATLAKCLEADLRVLGREHRQTLAAMGRLAWFYHVDGKFAEAETLLNQTLEIERRVLGAEDPMTLGTTTNLAVAYNAAGKFATAESLLQNSLEIERRKARPDDPGFLNIETHLAVVYVSQGKYAQADALYKQIVDAQRRVLGPENPQTLTSMAELAWVYDREGLYAQAEELCNQTLEIERRLEGPENPDTLQNTALLATIYYGEAKYSQAEAIDKQLLEIDRRLLGPQNPETLNEMDGLGWDEYLQGENAPAEALLKQTLDLFRRIFGPENPQTLNVAGNLGDVYVAEGKYAEADALYQQALETANRKLGPEIRQTLEIASDLGIMYQIEGKYALAEAYGQRAFTGRKHALGPQDPHAVGSANDYALALESDGKFAESEKVTREYLAIDEKAYPDHWQRFRAASLLGASLAGEKKYAEAEPLLVEGYKGLLARRDRIPAPYRYNLEFARKWLVQLYGAWGKPEKAAEWAKK